MKVFLSNMDKLIFDLALPKIVMNYDLLVTLGETYVIVESCDRALCQYDANDLIYIC